jgi:hypothetical protein
VSDEKPKKKKGFLWFRIKDKNKERNEQETGEKKTEDADNK